MNSRKGLEMIMRLALLTALVMVGGTVPVFADANTPVQLELQAIPVEQPAPKTAPVFSPLDAGDSVSFVLDDGNLDTNVGFGTDYSFLWLNRFTSPVFGQRGVVLNQIQLYITGLYWTGGVWAGLGIGDNLDLVIYEDTDGDGDPRNAVLRATQSVTVGVQNNWETYPLDPPVEVCGPDILIGVVNRTPRSYPAAMDTDTSRQRSWIFWWGGTPPEPATLPAPNGGLMDNFGFPGNWMIRGAGVEGANDPPTALNLAGSSVTENASGVKEVGTFSTTDPDSGDTHTYSLVSGAGDDDNDMFYINGDKLYTAETFNYEVKQSYSIRVQTADGKCGRMERAFTIDVVDVDEPPEATMQPASGVAGSAATLNAVVNQNSLSEDTTVHFVYGETADTTPPYTYDSATTPTNEGTGYSAPPAHAVAHALGGLTPGTKYYYRVVAENAAGTVYGNELWFYAGDVPVMQNDGADNIDQTRARLNATVVETKGSNTDVSFWWGTESGSWPNELVSDQDIATNGTTVDEILNGLAENTTYYYVAVGTNNNGSGWSAEESFKTLPKDPTIENVLASNIDTSSADIGALVNPQGAATNVIIWWGTSPGLANHTNQLVVTNVPIAETPQLVREHLSGLTDATIYYYHVEADNGSGSTIAGVEASFMTKPGGFGVVSPGVATDNGALLNVQNLTALALPADCAENMPAEFISGRAFAYDLPYGILQFDITNIDVGDTAHVGLDFTALRGGAQVFKCTQTAPGVWEWQDITRAADVIMSEARLEYDLTDVTSLAPGQRDSNALGGRITDPIAVGYSTLPIPTLGEWGLIAFVGIIGGYAARRLRRRR